MTYITEIDKAIGMHGKWKYHLKSAIDAKSSEFDVDKVRLDNACDFGKWLDSLPPEDKSNAIWKEVKHIHARFHGEAARVLVMALGGQSEAAERAIAFGSEFAKLSGNLTNTLMNWRKTL